MDIAEGPVIEHEADEAGNLSSKSSRALKEMVLSILRSVAFILSYSLRRFPFL